MGYLKEIHIEKYKSLKDVTVQFKDELNIVIGKNGSGKSNLLEFINLNLGIAPFIGDFSKKRITKDDFRYVFDYLVESSIVELTMEVKSVFSESVDDTVSLIKITKESTSYKLNSYYEAGLLQKFSVSNYSNLNDILERLQPIDSLHCKLISFALPSSLFWLTSPNNLTVSKSYINTDAVKGGETYFTTNGGIDEFDFPFFLMTHFNFKMNEIKEEVEALNIEKIKAVIGNVFDDSILFLNILDHLQKFSPIEGIKIGSNFNVYAIDEQIEIENLTFDFKISGVWMPWSHLSDGTKRLFFLIAQICCQNSLILIEEPELGIHPHQLYSLMRFIKEQSQYKQIIVSTHSPIVLDALGSDELDRITISEIKNGSSQFRKLSAEQITDAKKYMEEVAELSYYWLHSDLEENNG